MKKNYTEKQQRIKDQFCQERGSWKWNDIWETILMLNEDIVSTYSALSSVAHKKGYLEPRVKELIYIVMDSAITHLYPSGLRRHMVHAVKDLGITPGKIMETLLIASMISSSTYTVGFPILMRQLAERGNSGGDVQMTPGQMELKERFIHLAGYWNDTLEQILCQDVEILETYLDYLEASMSKQALEPRTREFLYITVNASATTLNPVEIERHIKLALNYGATREELLEVFDTVCCLGVHSILDGIPILNDVINR